MTLQEFLHSVGAYHIDSKNLSTKVLRDFVQLIRADATALPPETDLGYAERICRAFDQVCEEFGLPVDTEVEVVRLEEPEP